MSFNYEHLRKLSNSTSNLNWTEIIMHAQNYPECRRVLIQEIAHPDRCAELTETLRSSNINTILNLY